MNIFSALFGIFRQRGLVSKIREGSSLFGFTVSAIVVSISGGLAYGFAVGIGLGIETAIKDSIKVGLIVFLTLIFSIPIFWLALRLLGRDESFGQVAAIPLTLVSSVSIILAITSPIVFLLSVLTGFNPEAIYIHVVIVDVAILVGLYLSGTLIYHAYSDPRRLIIPNVVGILMMGVILVVLVSFLSPFLALRSTFSIGTDRLKDGLGIGVAQKVTNSLAAAAAADKVSYKFQTTNDNGDLVRDYTVTRFGGDCFIQVHLHAIPNEIYQNERRIWMLDGQYFTDFDDGRVTQVTYSDLTSFLVPSSSPAVFSLPADFSSASWRAYEAAGRYYATGTIPYLTQVTLVLDAATNRLSELTLGTGQQRTHAEVRVREIKPAELDPAAMEASLNQAIVVGNVDRSDASMNEVVQGEEFFVIRFPRTWRAGSWNSDKRNLELTTSCGFAEGCPHLSTTVYDLEEGKNPQQYAEDLGSTLRIQPEYREINTNMISISDNTVGIVEYLFDQTVKGELRRTHHVEYIFVGQNRRYHLDFSAPESQFENNRELFKVMAGMFTYLLPLP